MHRRQFILRMFQVVLGWMLGAMGLSSEAAARDRTTFELGFPRDYPPGTVKHLIFYDAFLISDSEGIYAISSVCTHRGGPLFKTDKNDAFVCRRHHARFDLTGNVVRGPAYSPLPWLKLELDQEGHILLLRKYKGERGKKIAHKNPKSE
ncbi:MAG: Rieske (2Fe-2S) protein [PVC group bacterium]